MSTTTDIDTRLTPVDAALTELDTALDHLTQLAADDGLPSHDALATVAFARRFETVRKQTLPGRRRSSTTATDNSSPPG